MLSLKSIEYAAKEEYGIGVCDRAGIFPVRVWEALKMIARDDELLQESENPKENKSSKWVVRLQREMCEYDRKVRRNQ